MFQPTDMFSVIKLASDTLPERYNPSLFNYFFETFPEGFIVAEQAHKTIGFIVGVKTDVENAKILMLSVSNSFRRKKIGSKLLEKFIKEIIKTETKIIALEVRVDNTDAINFYQNHGFTITDRISEFYQNGQDAFTMKKKF